MAKRLDLSTLAESETPELTKRPPRAVGRLAAVPPSRVAPNHVNPRKNFGSPEDLADLGRSLSRKQLQAIRCVSRGAYERLFPEHAEDLGHGVDVVVVNGERRYRAALAANLELIEAVIDDDLAESRQAFIDAVVTENVDRQNFDPIEEANAIDMLVIEFGSADAVAAHYGRSKGWVSQRRSLLRLTAEVQDLVRIGTIPIRRARELSLLPADDQLSAWEQETTPPDPAAPPETSAKAEAEPAPSRRTTSTKQKVRSTEPADVPPWDSPGDVADLLIEKMTKVDLQVLLRFLTQEVPKLAD